MSACTQHVDVHLIHADGHLAECLDPVRMEQDAVLMGDLPNLFHRLNGADLIIRKHNGDQDCILPDGGPKLLQINESRFVHIQIRHLVAPLFQILAGMQDGVVLDTAGNDVLPLGRVSLCCGYQRPVVGLASSRRKIDLLGLCPQDSGDLLPAAGDHLFICSSKSIDAGRIAVMLRKIGEHGLHHLRRRLGCGRIVQINSFFHIPIPPEM